MHPDHRQEQQPEYHAGPEHSADRIAAGAEIETTQAWEQMMSCRDAPVAETEHMVLVCGFDVRLDPQGFWDKLNSAYPLRHNRIVDTTTASFAKACSPTE